MNLILGVYLEEEVIDVEFMLLDKFTSINQATKFESIEYDRSGYFLEKCAQNWHKDNIHKVYLLVRSGNQSVLGYFSIVAKNIELRITEDEIKQYKLNNYDTKQSIPIVDITHLGIANDLDNTSKEWS